MIGSFGGEGGSDFLVLVGRIINHLKRANMAKMQAAIVNKGCKCNNCWKTDILLQIMINMNLY